MSRISIPDWQIREKFPNIRSKLTDVRGRITDSTVWLYRWFVFAAFIGIVGTSLLTGGLVLLPMLAFAGSVTGVVAAAAMFGTGLVLTVGVYLWLTL